MIKLVRLATLGLLAIGVASAHADSGKTFNAEDFVLENGMAVVVIPNHRAPVVHHAVWYKVGAADEDAGESGIAHMLEHMMFKGTTTIPPGEFSKIVSRNGGSDNAFTSHDYTGYYQNIARDRLELVMEMEADRMTNLAFREADFYTERDVVLEERRSRTDNRPRAQLAEQVNAVQYYNHPYGTPVIGWEHEIRSYAYEDALAFYRRHYAPNNAVLVVAGDITAAELRPLAERTYGRIPAGEPIVRDRPKEPPQRAARRVEMTDPRVTSLEWNRSYLAPGYVEGETRHAPALDVLAELLGGGTTSRLYQALVVDQKIASSAGAYYNGVMLGPARFYLQASPAEGVTVDTVEATIDAEIAAFIAQGIKPEDLSRAKFGLIAQATYARDSLSSMARIFGNALSIGLTVEGVESWPQEIEAVTADAVIDAARAVLRKPASVTGILRPGPDDQAG